MEEKDRQRMLELYFNEMYDKQEIVDYFGGKYTYREISETLKARIREYLNI